MVTANTPLTHKMGDYSQKELDKLMSIPRGTKNIGKIIGDLANKWGRRQHNVYLKWNTMHPKKDKDVVDVSTPEPVKLERKYSKNGVVVNYQKGKDIQELVLEVGGDGPTRGMKSSTMQLLGKLKPLVEQMLPIGNPKNIVHSIPFASSAKESVRKFLRTQFPSNKYTISTVPDNKKVSRIFRSK